MIFCNDLVNSLIHYKGWLIHYKGHYNGCNDFMTNHSQRMHSQFMHYKGCNSVTMVVTGLVVLKNTDFRSRDCSRCCSWCERSET